MFEKLIDEALSILLNVAAGGDTKNLRFKMGLDHGGPMGLVGGVLLPSLSSSQ